METFYFRRGGTDSKTNLQATTVFLADVGTTNIPKALTAVVANAAQVMSEGVPTTFV